MAIQTVFQRYEMKYLLTPDQKEAVLRAMQPYMEPDRYGRTSIRNLYYDTDNYRLIRRSIERPVYKEKLRVRSYGRAEPDGVVFAELKKKYKHTVYKRRLPLRAQEAGGLARRPAAVSRSDADCGGDRLFCFLLRNAASGRFPVLRARSLRREGRRRVPRHL